LKFGLNFEWGSEMLTAENSFAAAGDFLSPPTSVSGWLEKNRNLLGFSS
jgi:hypothetical protein